jgi:hypothetical protein
MALIAQRSCCLRSHASAETMARSASLLLHWHSIMQAVARIVKS